MTPAIAFDPRPDFVSFEAELHARDLQLFAHLRQAAEIRDPGSATHMQRMPQYARLICRGLGLPFEQEEIVLAASALHDIGKLGVPDAILRKRTPLDPYEQVLARRHVRHGHAILRHGTSPLVRAAAEIALRHHEHFDGRGYPDALAGDAIPLYARIAAVADVFDAMTSHRPHRRACGTDTALEFLLAQRSLQFDPDCVDAFVAEEHRVHDIRARYCDPGTHEAIVSMKAGS